MKKRKYESDDFIGRLPPVTPFTPCDLVSPFVNDTKIAIKPSPFHYFQRVINPKKDQDQSELRYTFRRREKDASVLKDFPIIKFSFRDANYPTPNIPKLTPAAPKSTLGSDGIRHYITFRPDKESKFLRPPKDRSHTTKPSLSEICDNIVLELDNESNLLTSATSSLFKSVLKATSTYETTDISISDPPIKLSTSQNYPVPVLPSVVSFHLVDQLILNYEHDKLANPPKLPQRMIVTHGKSQETACAKYLRKPSDLNLSQGEFTVVEYVCESCIIQPLIGMVSKLDVLIDDPSSGDHPFDPRIPLTHVSQSGIQPFIARIPKNMFVIALTNRVAASIVGPQKPLPTDFILTIGYDINRKQITTKLFQMPPTIYTSTEPESRVTIPQPSRSSNKANTLYLRDFKHHSTEAPLRPEEICKQRAIFLGLRDLDRRGIAMVRPITAKRELGFRSALGHLPPSLRSGVMEYIHALKRTPWARAETIKRMRMGVLSASVELQQGSTLEERRRIFNESFRNQILEVMDQGALEEGVDAPDFLLFLDNEDEDEEDDEQALEVALGVDGDDSFVPGPHTHRFDVDWRKIPSPVLDRCFRRGVGMRPVMKTITYEIENEAAVAHVEYTRDLETIKATNAKKNSNLNVRKTNTLQSITGERFWR